MGTDDRPVASASGTATRQSLNALLLGLCLCALWAVTHKFAGVSLDGELYAMQALSRIHPNLLADLYLQHNNQDRFTVFSPLYAQAIRVFGLINAATILFAVSTVWLLAASYALASCFSDRRSAWLAVAGLVIFGGAYGPFHIFSFTENIMTARLLGEALTVTACVCFLRRWWVAAVAVGIAAVMIHPIMALPGILLMISVTIGFRRAASVAAAGLVLLTGVALIIRAAPQSLPFIRLIDGQWLEVVRERSQFLFIQYWDRAGYERALRPFICLTLTMLAVKNVRIQRISAAAMLVGAVGLAINAIASLISPIAVVLQGQSWRWMWITTLCCLVLLPTTLHAMLRDERCGRFCALGLLLSWAFPDVNAVIACLSALGLWALRERLTSGAARMLRWGAVAAVVLLLLWILGNMFSLLNLPNEDAARGTLWESRVRDVMGLGLPSVISALLMCRLPAMLRSPLSKVVAIAAMASVVILFLPGSLRTLSTAGTEGEVEEFADWRNRIPGSSSVLDLPVGNAADFVWFTLHRPSFLTVNQEAGVVFSPETAAEVARRSHSLLPVSPHENWRIYSAIEHRHGSAAEEPHEDAPLTAAGLKQICADPSLGFVISKDSIGYRAIEHQGRGARKHWSLYDCGYVRVANDAG